LPNPGFRNAVPIEECDDMDTKDPAGHKQNGSSKPPVAGGDAPLEPAGEVVVSHEERAAKPSPGKQIHRRRPLPPVPEGGSKQPGDDREPDES
jgi:hypothetical protein